MAGHQLVASLLVFTTSPCRTKLPASRSDTINVGWDGRIYDCDFNQQLEIEAVVPEMSRPHVRDFDLAAWQARPGDGTAPEGGLPPEAEAEPAVDEGGAEKPEQDDPPAP